LLTVGAGHVACMGKMRKLRERTHFKDTGVDGRIIFKWIFKKWVGGSEWIDLAQSGEIGRAVVNALMNLRVP